jgi:hypothetical protein
MYCSFPVLTAIGIDMVAEDVHYKCDVRVCGQRSNGLSALGECHEYKGGIPGDCVEFFCPVLV